MYGNKIPLLRRLAIKALLQTTLSFVCERNWSIFALIHTKQPNCLTYPKFQLLVMKLNLWDMEVENDKVVEIDFLNLLNIWTEHGEEKDN